MAAAGLVGLEVDHPDQGPDDRTHAARLARELNLLPTGSSDYHGRNKTTALGAELTSAQVYEQLLALPAAAGPRSG
jgi:predicted metal-dependent phosphoesterase TrpH